MFHQAKLRTLSAFVAAMLTLFVTAHQAVAVDCNSNGVEDATDISTGTSLDCDSNGVPDECAMTPVEQSKLTASDAATNDYFGYSVSISGDWAVIGAYLDDDAGAASGSAYMFRWNGATWVEKAKLTASDAAGGDYFGYSVSISGDVVLVGANLDDDGAGNSGSAYVFRWNGVTWVEESKLTASDAAFADEFGYSVSISGDRAVVGAYSDDDAGSETGSAYVFRWDGANWVEESKLTASDGAAGDRFGYSVSISGDRAVIGAYLDDDTDYSSGSAYVFRWNGANWVEESKLTASDGARDYQFGYSVSISDNVAVIGAPYSNDAGTESGSAYVFLWDGANWVEEPKLTASDGAAYDCFGISVSISGDWAVIGAYFDDDAGRDSGSAYVFGWDGANWVQRPKMTASDAAASDNFGNSVSISGNRAAIGAYYNDDAGGSSGSAYIFQLDNNDCNGNGIPDECDFSSGTSQDCNASGVPDECEISEGTSPDGNGDGIPDECQVINLTQGTYHLTIPEAIAAAVDHDQLLAPSQRFVADAVLDFSGKALTLTSWAEIAQPADATMTLANNSSVAAATGEDITLSGQLRVDSGSAADVFADTLSVGSTGMLNSRTNSSLYLTVPVSTIDGTMRLEGNSTMSFGGSVTSNGSLTTLSGSSLLADNALDLGGSSTVLSASIVAGTVDVNGSLNFSNSVLSATSVLVGAAGRFVGYGELYATVMNGNRIYTTGDTLIVGDLDNTAGAVFTIQVGTTTLIGSLINNGTIVGEIQVPGRAIAENVAATASTMETQPGDGFSVQGDYVAGAASSLSMPDTMWRITVAGDFDIAIDDNARYDMLQAELRLNGGASASQSLEVMSRDVGPVMLGMRRELASNYPIGTLRIGPMGTTVDLVDTHDNDTRGQGAAEAIYVDQLLINAGATLNTGGKVIYYKTLTNDGSVDNPDNLIAIVPVPADFDNDGDVDGGDFVTFAACVSGPGLPHSGTATCDLPDLNDDNDVDLEDFAVFHRYYSGQDNPVDPGR